MVSISPTWTGAPTRGITSNTTFVPTFSEEWPLASRASISMLAGLLVAGACTKTMRTIVLDPPPSPEVRAAPAAGATLGIPPGHLPKPGECRVWIPGMPPGQQPQPKSRPCPGIAPLAPAGSWIVYRPSEDKKVGDVREGDAPRAGAAVRTRSLEFGATRL